MSVVSFRRHTGIPGLWTQALNGRLWTLETGPWTLDAEVWTLDAELWTLNSGRWTVYAGLWLMGTFVNEGTQFLFLLDVTGIL